jgi:hypothetical protein
VLGNTTVKKDHAPQLQCYKLSYFSEKNITVHEIAAGRDHATFLCQRAGTDLLDAYTCGTNSYQQLCRTTTTAVDVVPRNTYNNEQLKNVYCGVYNSLIHTGMYCSNMNLHSIVGEKKDNLWLAGHNYFNCPGMENKLTKIDTSCLGDERIDHISHGYCFFLTCSSHGNVFICGLNIQVSNTHMLRSTSKGTTWNSK